MENLTEIRWHGRGGQGAKTAALLLADAAMGEGKFVQAFPEYGPERMGAPVQSFNRLSEKPISLHCSVTSPSVVVVLDPSLINTVDVTKGLPEDGALLFNTPLSPEEMREKIGLSGKRIFTVDASSIALKTIGRDIPNTPMLGALAKATGLLDFDRMIHDTRAKLSKKFASRPEVIEGNVKAIETAYDEVKGEE
ncbi:MAG: 2-oxoacid:acceptor oxidoreductase family protein [bacterium]|nr:2-oxoacid:acceptor oxidoreductase family protein [bacterium]